MAKPKKYKFKDLRFRRYINKSAVLYAVTFGVTGLIFLAVIAAAGNNVSIEPEGGRLSGNASVGSDSNASNGSFAQFGTKTYSVPSSITADCSIDVAVVLNTWLSSVPNGAKVNFPADACYLAEQAIKIDNKQGWVVKGNNATIERNIYDSTNNMRHLHLSNVSNFTMSDFNIVGQKDPSGGYAVAVEDQMGVGVFGGSNVTVDNFNISHVHGDFVYINKYQGTTAQNITIKNSTFTDAGRQGIAIIDVDGATVKDNSITNVDRYIIDTEPGGANTSVKDFTFDHNATSGGGIGWLSGEGGGGNITNMVISNNTVSGPMTIKIDPPSTFRRGPLTIINNTSLKEAGGDLFQLHAVDGILIKGNRTKLKLNGAGSPVLSLVSLFDTTNARIIDNITEGALASVEVNAGAIGYCEFGNTPMSLGIPLCP